VRRTIFQSTVHGFSPDFQVCFPHRGGFVWHVADKAVVGDPNQVLFVYGDEEFHVSHPWPEGYEELIVTPTLSVLSDLARVPEGRVSSHPLFGRRNQYANPALQNRRPESSIQ